MATEAAMTSVPALVGRLSWMMVGPFCLAICALSIAQRGDGWLSPPDLLYLLVLGGMLIGRWSEFRFGLPLTATGEPASAEHLRRYVWVVAGLGLAIWLAANLVGNHAIPIPG
jgi:hypothetical protein